MAVHAVTHESPTLSLPKDGTLTWQALLDSMPALSAVLDRSGRIVAVNAAWRRLADELGGAASAVQVGRDYLRTCGAVMGAAEADIEEMVRGLRDVLGGLRSDFRYEFACQIGTEQRWYLTTAAPLAGGAGALVSHTDLSSRQRAEEVLKKRAVELASMARRLKQTNEELDQFAYITSHDLKAPLRGIANLSRWIEEDMGDQIPPAVHEQFELLRGRVHRMESLIEGLLQYSRVGRVFTYVEQIDVNRLLADVIDMLSPPPGFRVEIEGQMPIVRGERIRLQQVFMNLISNAIKHHHRDSGRVTIRVEDAGAFWRFGVSDDGPGIAPRYHEKIFVIFQTLVPRDQKEAAGVGLSLVKKIVEEQGGKIEVQSDEGAGATFWFTWAKHRAER